ncbi:MAG: CBS domain-containing protein [Polyangiaceae bacterium]
MTKLTAKDIMTRDLVTVRVDMPVEQLTELLLSRSISGAPVLNEAGKPVGVVSITDVMRSRNADQTSSDDHIHDYYKHALEQQYGKGELEMAIESELSVADIMTPMVFEVPEDAPVQRVADEMLRGHIHRVFVTRGHELQGVITSFDMVRVVRDL